MTERSTGRVEALWIKRASRAPMDRVDRMDLVAGEGIVGNANRGGRRQVTLITQEAWDAVQERLNARIDPSARRANVLLRGVDLADSRDRILALGSCRVRIRGETRPCTLLESARPGLRDALDPDWRGGAFGEVVTGGVVSVGDEVSWVEADR